MKLKGDSVKKVRAIGPIVPGSNFTCVKNANSYIGFGGHVKQLRTFTLLLKITDT